MLFLHFSISFQQETVNDEFAFSAAIKFYDDDTYTGAAKSGTFEVNNNAKVSSNSRSVVSYLVNSPSAGTKIFFFLIL